MGQQSTIRLWKCFVWWPLWLSTHEGWCAQPRAVISGSDPAVAGEILVLDAQESEGDPTHFSWQVRPVLQGRKQLLEIDQGRRVIVATYPGEYVISLVVSHAEGHDIAHRRIVIPGSLPDQPPAPTPPPTPTPTPPPAPGPAPVPAGEFDITRPVSELARKVVSPQRETELQQLVQAVEQLVAPAAAGALSPQEIVNALAKSVKALPAPWDVVRLHVKESLERHYAAGHLETNERWALYLKELLLGLRDARKT